MKEMNERLQKLDDRITAAVTRPNSDSAIVCELELKPVNGMNMNKVFPPTYKGLDKDWEYHIEDRWDDEEKQKVCIVVLDSIQSCANRMEEIARHAQIAKLFAIGNSAIQFKSGKVYSTLVMPHRIFDAAMRDCTIDGTPFADTEIGMKLYGDDLEVAARTAFEFCPCATLFGGWCSQVNNTSRALKSGRFVVNEVIAGYISTTHRTGGRIDPLKIEDKFEIVKSNEYGSPWTISKVSKKSAKKSAEESEESQESQEGDEVLRNTKEKTSKKKMSDLGHGNIPPSMRDKHGKFLSGGVSVNWIKDRFTIFLKKTMEYSTGDLQEDILVRRYLVFLGIYLFVEKSHKYELRSGTSLDRTGPNTTFNFSSYGKLEPFDLTQEEALELCVNASIDVQHIFGNILGQSIDSLERVIEGSKPVRSVETLKKTNKTNTK